MPASKVEAGFTVMVAVPVPVTLEEVTGMASMILVVAVSWISMVPETPSTLSEKVRTRFAVSETSVALSEGEVEERVGSVASKSQPSLFPPSVMLRPATLMPVALVLFESVTVRKSVDSHGLTPVALAAPSALVRG